MGEDNSKDVCFHCRSNKVVWDSDYSMNDYYGDGRDGIVQILHCENCGAEIEYRIYFDED